MAEILEPKKHFQLRNRRQGEERKTDKSEAERKKTRQLVSIPIHGSVIKGVKIC